jgi:hypothetical protein
METNSKKFGKRTSDTALTAAPSLKPAIYVVNNRLTTSEDEWLRQQKKLVNEAYRKSKSPAQ